MRPFATLLCTLVRLWAGFAFVTFENLAVVECIKQSLKSHFLATEALIDSVEFIGTTHTHPFNGPLSRTTQVSWYQKGKKAIWNLLKQETVSGSGISWALLQTDNHASTPPLSFFTD